MRRSTCSLAAAVRPLFKAITLDLICQTYKSTLPIQKQNGAPPHLARDAPSCTTYALQRTQEVQQILLLLRG
jgi:hypothetical protein